MTPTYNYLHFVPLCNLINWSVAHLLESDLGFSDKYPFVKIGDILYRNSDTITVADDVEYKQVTLKTNGGGAVLRDTKLGKDIGTKKQYRISAGQFIMSKIDARNGAFAVVTDELDGAIVTGDFPSFNVNKDRVNPSYLYLLSATSQFVRFAQSCSRGTTNRQRIDISQFLNVKIPLPSIEEQNKIVTAYNAAIEQAEKLSTQAQKIDEQIQNYLLQELSIETEKKTDYNQANGFLHVFHYSQILERWDLLNASSVIIDKIQNTKYKVVTIGSAFKCVMRSWKKHGTLFNYIEMGCVNPTEGITGSQKIETKKAPSRATQIVHTGDLIIGTTRPYLKRFAIVTEQYHNNVCSSAFQVIAPDESYNLHFLHEILLTPLAIEQFEHYMTGALYPAITNKDLRKIQIPLPPLSIQNEIVEHINALRTEQKQLRQQSAELKSSAIQQFEQAIFK